MISYSTIRQSTSRRLLSWQIHGLCRTMDPEVFFHPEGERGGSRRRRIEQAKSICERCPVIEECRTYALDHHEAYGVWGGLSEEERADIQRARTYARRIAASGHAREHKNPALKRAAL